MMVVDLMHEVELNVWKAIFIHLLRILDCENEALKHELDRRYELFHAEAMATTHYPSQMSRNTSVWARWSKKNNVKPIRIEEDDCP
jgi:hypothetical protein